MKKIIAIALALMLCVTALSVSAFAAEGDTITIHVQVPEGTATPNYWAWGAAASMPEGAAWPGVAMTADGEWYTFEVAVGTTGLVINTDGDNDKSADITITGDCDAWIVCSIGDDGHFVADNVSYDAPEADAPEADAPEADAPEADAPEADAPEADEPAKTGDMGLAAVSVALLAATAGLVAIVSKKEN